MLFKLIIKTQTQTLLETIFLMDAISEVGYYFDFLEKPLGKTTTIQGYQISISSAEQEIIYYIYESTDIEFINKYKEEILDGIAEKTKEYKLLEPQSKPE